MRMGLKVPTVFRGVPSSAMVPMLPEKLTVFFSCPGVMWIFPCIFPLAASRSHPWNDSMSYGPLLSRPHLGLMQCRAG